MYLVDSMNTRSDNNKRHRSGSRTLKLSKTLSWLLRHGAKQEGLNIGEDGYVDLVEILQRKEFSEAKCTVDDIKALVSADEKGRFDLRVCDDTDQLKIRANQGHSMRSILELDLVNLNNLPTLPTVVHGTFYRHWESIIKTGLSRMKRNHIHFVNYNFTDFTQSHPGLRNNCQILIFINVSKAIADGIDFFLSKNDVILSEGNLNGYISKDYFLKAIDHRSNTELKF